MIFLNGFPPARIVRGVLISLFMVLSACSNIEGEGGTGSISGILNQELWNDDYSLKISSNPAVDEEVFILYGDEQTVGDRVVTGPGGAFCFKFLYPGNYTIYYMSDEPSNSYGEEVEVMRKVELKRGEDLELGSLIRIKTLDYDDGAATIKGKVIEIDYDIDEISGEVVASGMGPALKEDVYLTYGAHEFYDKRVRTQYDGGFAFTGLIPGNYLIFLYSDDPENGGDKIVIKRNVTITAMDQVLDLGDITVADL